MGGFLFGTHHARITASAGVVTRTAAAWLPNGIRITAVRSGHEQLAIERWEDPFLAWNVEYTLENYFVTVSRTQKGDLDVEVWETSSNTGGPPPQ